MYEFDLPTMITIFSTYFLHLWFCLLSPNPLNGCIRRELRGNEKGSGGVDFPLDPHLPTNATQRSTIQQRDTHQHTHIIAMVPENLI